MISSPGARKVDSGHTVFARMLCVMMRVMTWENFQYHWSWSVGHCLITSTKARYAELTHFCWYPVLFYKRITTDLNKQGNRLWKVGNEKDITENKILVEITLELISLNRTLDRIFQFGKILEAVIEKSFFMLMHMTVVLGLYKFNLQATIDHHGSFMYSGHYTASLTPPRYWL